MISKHKRCSWSLTAVKIVKIYTCDTCHKRTQKSTILSLASAVMRALAGCKKRKRFQCSGCRRSFGQKSSLHVHRRKHSKSKPHKCAECNKKFITRSGLAMHKKGHTAKQVNANVNDSSTDVSAQDNNHDIKMVVEKDESESMTEQKEAYPACTRLKQLLKMVESQENKDSCDIKKEISAPKKESEHPKTRLFLSSKRKKSLLTLKSSPVTKKLCSKVKKDKNMTDIPESASNVISYFVNVQMGDTSKHVLVTSEEKGNSFDIKTDPDIDISMHSASAGDHSNMFNQEFNKSSSLSVDVKSQPDKNKSLSFKCKYCTESFETMELLVEHKKSHKTKRPIKAVCPWTHCKKRLTSQKRLDSHLKRHNGETHYLCHKCGMQFTDCVFYKKHRIVCLQRCRIYECKVCGKELSGYSALEKHHRVHTGEKPSQCEICGARFNNNSHLTRHKRIHIRKGEMPPPEGYTPPTAETLQSVCGVPDVPQPQNYTEYATCLEIGNEQVVAYCVEEENAFMETSQQTELMRATSSVAKQIV